MRGIKAAKEDFSGKVESHLEDNKANWVRGGIQHLSDYNGTSPAAATNTDASLAVTAKPTASSHNLRHPVLLFLQFLIDPPAITLFPATSGEACITRGKLLARMVL